MLLTSTVTAGNLVDAMLQKRKGMDHLRMYGNRAMTNECSSLSNKYLKKGRDYLFHFIGWEDGRQEHLVLHHHKATWRARQTNRLPHHKKLQNAKQYKTPKMLPTTSLKKGQAKLWWGSRTTCGNDVAITTMQTVSRHLLFSWSHTTRNVVPTHFFSWRYAFGDVFHTFFSVDTKGKDEVLWQTLFSCGHTCGSSVATCHTWRHGVATSHTNGNSFAINLSSWSYTNSFRRDPGKETAGKKTPQTSPSVNARTGGNDCSLSLSQRVSETVKLPRLIREAFRRNSARTQISITTSSKCTIPHDLGDLMWHPRNLSISLSNRSITF